MENKKSILDQILDGAIEMVKRPFVEKRIQRSFDSASDSLEEQLLSNQAQLTQARENLVNAAKEGSPLTSYVQKLIDLQTEKSSIEVAQKALKVEKTEFLGK